MVALLDRTFSPRVSGKFEWCIWDLHHRTAKRVADIPPGVKTDEIVSDEHCNSMRGVGSLKVETRSPIVANPCACVSSTPD